jgi:Superinfection immunity protein
MKDISAEILTLALLLFLFSIYLTPSIIAIKNQKRAAGAIGALNILFGWTIVGWIVALFWAMNKKVSVPHTPSSGLMATFPPLLMTSTEKECPGCAGMVPAEATKCRFCALDLTVLPTAQQHESNSR